MAFVIRPYPEWSWSQSRNGIFQECQRKYYYHYYQSHNGWLRDAKEDARSAYRLKQMSNLYLLLGDGLHQMAEQAMKQWRDEKTLPNADDSYERIRQHLNLAYLDSKRLDQWKRTPKKVKMLHEMYYGDGDSLPEHRVELIKERMQQCTEQFFKCRTLQELQKEESIRIKEIEELNTFTIDGSKVYVKLDLLYQRDDTWVIVDWKTGMESEKNDQQLLLYALFLQERYGVPFDKIEIRVEYLLSGECNVVPMDVSILEEIKQGVIQSMDGMRSCLEDPVENVPKPMDDFLANPHRSRCLSCSYRELCEDKILE